MVWLVFGGALVSVLALSACSSEEEASVGDEGEASVGDEGEASVGDDGEASVGDEGDDPSWSELVARLKNAEYQVTYDSKDASGSQGQLTIAVKGEKTYVAFNFEGDQLFEDGLLAGQDRFTGVEIDDGTNSYSCGDLAGLFGLFGGGSETGDVCYKSESVQEDDLPSLRDMFNPAGLGLGLSGAQAERDGSESIAGREAKCFKIEGVEEVISSGRICVERSSGVPLLMEGTDSEGATFSQRAIELSEKVDDAVFEPPYEVKDFSEILPAE